MATSRCLGHANCRCELADCSRPGSKRKQGSQPGWIGNHGSPHHERDRMHKQWLISHGSETRKVRCTPIIAAPALIRNRLRSLDFVDRTGLYPWLSTRERSNPTYSLAHFRMQTRRHQRFRLSVSTFTQGHFRAGPPLSLGKKCERALALNWWVVYPPPVR